MDTQCVIHQRIAKRFGRFAGAFSVVVFCCLVFSGQNRCAFKFPRRSILNCAVLFAEVWTPPPQTKNDKVTVCQLDTFASSVWPPRRRSCSVAWLRPRQDSESSSSVDHCSDRRGRGCDSRRYSATSLGVHWRLRPCGIPQVPSTNSPFPHRDCKPRRSEERRVGKEGRSRWAPDALKKKKKTEKHKQGEIQFVISLGSCLWTAERL